jgi:hypothetical protein
MACAIAQGESEARKLRASGCTDDSDFLALLATSREGRLHNAVAAATAKNMHRLRALRLERDEKSKVK